MASQTTKAEYERAYYRKTRDDPAYLAKERARGAKKRASGLGPMRGTYTIKVHAGQPGEGAWYSVHAPSYLDPYGRITGVFRSLAAAKRYRARLARGASK